MTVSWKENIELAIKALALVGIGFGVFEFFHNNAQEMERAQQSASSILVTQYDREIAEKVEDIEFVLSPIMATRGADAFSENSLNPILEEEIHDLFSVLYFGVGLDTGRPLAPSWLDVLRYYDNAWICLDLDVCDREYLAAFLCDRAEDFWDFQKLFIEFYNNKFELKRDNSASVGDGLGALVTSCNN